MGITGSIIVYISIWWIVFFSLLPVGIKSNNKNGIPGAVKYINISSKRLHAEYKKKHIKLEEGLRITNNWYKLLLNIN